MAEQTKCPVRRAVKKVVREVRNKIKNADYGSPAKHDKAREKEEDRLRAKREKPQRKQVRKS